MDDLAKRPLQDRLKRIFDGAGGSDELVELLAEFDMEGSRELADAITLALGDYSRMLGANEALRAELARLRALGDAMAVAMSEAAAELEYFVEFAQTQCEFEGDIRAGLAVVRQSRAALATWNAEAAR